MIEGTPGESVLDLAIANDIRLEGACGGAMSCSTCHVYVTQQKFLDILPKQSEEELDLLELAKDPLPKFVFSTFFQFFLVSK